ncbi:Thiol-disulfide isomerase or thioredoxin [Humidesulfovibrio mexicanus]|uniref:Thiol-disulfide isomerase or thioredoxin n=1 Tax=Humidesulfovibrio mexicanus TaxID=147047 RepID=A0A239CTG4_9BACT|nr:TlpA disulfide reductase family protein [Humidesulfovibrio mexicanus]SNS23505.1 Thiol-disulfide isomerase or thioredoxin [Humidesulfovibrio mexicanus]
MNAYVRPLWAGVLSCLLLLAACSGDATAPAPSGGKLETLDMPAVEQRFAANKGKITLVMFWATWCPACKTELPVLEQLRAKYPPEELDILAISVDDTEEIMAEYLKSRPTTVPVYLSKAEVGSEFGVKGVPALYVLDKNGQVAFNSAGAYPFEMLDQVIGPLARD